MSAGREGASPVPGAQVSINVVARVVHVSGELDVATRKVLTEAGEYLFAAATADIVVDLAGLSFVDAAGLGAIVELRNAQSKNRRQLRLRAVPPSIARVFQLAGLGTMLAQPDSDRAGTRPAQTSMRDH